MQTRPTAVLNLDPAGVTVEKIGEHTRIKLMSMLDLHDGRRQTTEVIFLVSDDGISGLNELELRDAACAFIYQYLPQYFVMEAFPVRITFEGVPIGKLRPEGIDVPRRKEIALLSKVEWEDALRRTGADLK